MAMNANGGEIVYSVKVDASGAVVGIKNAEGRMAAAASEAGDKSGNALNKTFSAATVALGNIISNVVTSAMQKVSQSINGAIARVDTFNKYPKVLSNFGISAEEAAASIKRIDDSLKGLPISLNAGVAGVQGLFFATKDLGQAEETFKAITDAALVFTTDATTASDNFIYAYKQAMAAGKVSAQDFNQMNSAIPGLMDKIAESMGMNVQQMKTGLSDGTVSVEEFNKAFLKLDKEGGSGMNAMADVAKDSVSGIQTAINLMNTTIERTIGNIIDKVGSEKIEQAFNILGTIIESVGTVIINIVTFLSNNEVVFWAIVAVIAAITAALIAYNVAATIAAISTTALTWPILLAVAAIVALIAIIILVITHLQEIGEFFRTIFGGIGEFVGGVVKSIGEWFNDLFTNIGNGIRGVWEAVTGVFGAIGGWIYNNVISPIANFFSGLWNAITIGVNAVSNGIKSVFGAIVGIIKAPINGIISGINSVIDKINSIQVPDWVPVIGGAHTNFPHVPYLATGGIVESTVGGRLIVAGEGGEDEWVVPESKMASLIDQLNGAGAGGETINIYVDGVFATSADERRKVAEDIMEAYNQNQKRRFANA